MNRRRSLLNTNDYVKDELLLWLDGLNNTRHGHNAGSENWEDISGNGLDCSLIGDVSIFKNAYLVTNTTTARSYILNDNKEIEFTPNASWTFECLYQISAPAQIMAAYFNNETLYQIWCNSTSEFNARFLNRRFPASGSYTHNSSTPTLFAVTYDSKENILKYYLNGIELFNSIKNTTSVRTGFTLGARLGGALLNNTVTFYSARYYTKALNANEIVKNLSQDKRRYNF